MFNKIGRKNGSMLRQLRLSKIKKSFSARRLLYVALALITIFSGSIRPALAIVYSSEEMEKILYYNPNANQSSCDPAATPSVPGSCPVLAEARKTMWNAASDNDKRRFMNVVEKEDYGLAAVEAYMNQVISKYGKSNDGSLSSWLGNQCVAFMANGATKCAKAKSSLTEQDNKLLQMALGGSNIVQFAVGNATGGSSVGAGKIVCIWKQDSKKPELGYCRTDVDLSKESGNGKCQVYAPTSGFGECWGLEGNAAWAESTLKACKDSGSTATTSTGGSKPLTGPAPTQLRGETNADKVWNYFIDRGLTPVAAAGAMGNIEQESSFDPFIVEGGGGTGFGLIQWSFGRRTALESAAAQAGVSLVKSAANNDKALLFQLDYLWDKEHGKMTWQEQVNAETTVDGNPSIGYQADNTGNGSTMVFHKYVERSGDDTKGKQERINGAKAFLAKYGVSDAISCDSFSGLGTVGEGGLTLEQAKAFVMRYGENVNGFSAKQSGPLWGMCNGGGSNCVTFSYFFNHTFTDLPAAPGDGNGHQIVSSLNGKGANTGTTPGVFSTFSWSNGGYGHTGIVLGIHGDQIIVGHASCSSKGRGKGSGEKSGGGSAFVLVGKLSDNKAFWGTTPSGFAYPKTVNIDAINKFISQGYL